MYDDVDLLYADLRDNASARQAAFEARIQRALERRASRLEARRAANALIGPRSAEDIETLAQLIRQGLFSGSGASLQRLVARGDLTPDQAAYLAEVAAAGARANADSDDAAFYADLRDNVSARLAARQARRAAQEAERAARVADARTARLAARRARWAARGSATDEEVEALRVLIEQGLIISGPAFARRMLQEGALTPEQAAYLARAAD